MRSIQLPRTANCPPPARKGRIDAAWADLLLSLAAAKLRVTFPAPRDPTEDAESCCGRDVFPLRPGGRHPRGDVSVQIARLTQKLSGAGTRKRAGRFPVCRRKGNERKRMSNTSSHTSFSNRVFAPSQPKQKWFFASPATGVRLHTPGPLFPEHGLRPFPRRRCRECPFFAPISLLGFR